MKILRTTIINYVEFEDKRYTRTIIKQNNRIGLYWTQNFNDCDTIVINGKFADYLEKNYNKVIREQKLKRICE